MIFLLGLILLALVSFGQADLRKEDKSEGACVSIERDKGDPKFFTRSARGSEWYISMGSEYGARYNAEIINGQPALTDFDLQIPDPIIVTSSDDPIKVALVVKDIVLKGDCIPKKHTEFKEYLCDVYRGRLGPGQHVESEDIKWKLLGHPTTTIFKSDPDHKYVLANVCSVNTSTRYWLAISKDAILSEEVQKKIRNEVKETGEYKTDELYILYRKPVHYPPAVFFP